MPFRGGMHEAMRLAAQMQRKIEATKKRIKDFVRRLRWKGPVFEISALTREGCQPLVRAVYEGLSFAARDCYLAMGEMPVEVRIAGGAARSATLRGSGMRAAVMRGPPRD